MTRKAAKTAAKRAGKAVPKVNRAARPMAAHRGTGGPTPGSGKTTGIIWPGRNDPRVLAQIAALKGLSTEKLRERWTELFDTAPPPVGRGYLEGRLTHRIQELAYVACGRRHWSGCAIWRSNMRRQAASLSAAGIAPSGGQSQARA